MKPGRNQPCPCGSGKKYKHCCLEKISKPSPELYYIRLSEAYNRLVDRLIDYADRIFDENAVGRAMHEFLLWPEVDDRMPEGLIDRIESLFWPWYLFNWEYDPMNDASEHTNLKGRTVTELYAENHAHQLSTQERHLIESVLFRPYSFLEILSVEKGTGMTLEDILKGTRIEVQERSGSENVQPGDIFFGRAVSVDGVGMLIGLSSYVIPPGRKPDIIRLRRQLRGSQKTITDQTLYEYDTEIRELYFHLDRALFSMPELQNTDGHPLEFHRLHYDISSADQTFEKLHDLCVTSSKEELLENAIRDDDGRIVRIEFPWIREGNGKDSPISSTVLAQIVIDERKLTAEVNSAERATALRREIDVRLGKDGRFRFDKVQDPKSVMSKPDAGYSERVSSKEQDDLMQLPEVQEHLKQMIEKHWDSWVDMEIPALGGITPREAVKTSDGREAVEALLMDSERDRRQDPVTADINRQCTRKVRETLGLSKD